MTADAIVAELLTGATTTGLIALGAWIVAAVVGLLILASPLLLPRRDGPALVDRGPGWLSGTCRSWPRAAT